MKALSQPYKCTFNIEGLKMPASALNEYPKIAVFGHQFNFVMIYSECK